MKKLHRNPYRQRRTASLSLSTPKIMISKAVIKVVSIFLVGFITAVLTYFVWPDIMNAIDMKIFGKPEIIVNINEILPLENEQDLENFHLMFGTANGQGTILAAQIGQPELNKIFGDTLIPIDFGRNGNNLEYFICILNNGDRKARDVRVTFTGDTLKTDYNVDVDKRIDFVSCGGSDCDIRKKELAANDKVGMFVKARTPSITNVNINAKGNYESFVNYRRFYVRMFVEGESIQIFLDENKVAELPPLNQNSNLLHYYYSQIENKWIAM